ncbi:TylF/MycF/NovP-related O-methyltransferase [Mucilaginibacter flavidus]|uniref:TylF/MycF/NovP-related O-methyltransferase n=1 Tax=Mucilaginibacter flavidus TaxID=2949309 RepID=UPI00209343BC|nr:TylF/MycF/NovP-related O-methyltransferase [Mucilaginibacter flavidus]MCO5947659.1 TylF/MycF family methyltransferase [Mucilaginibacter flavidus]
MKRIIKKILPGKLVRTIKELAGADEKNGVDLGDYYLLKKSDVTYAQDMLYTFHSADFMKDPHFLHSYELGKQTDGGHLLKDYDIHWRTHVQCWAASHAALLEGDFVDCGVSTGIFARSVINFVGFQNLKKKYYLLDTFAGMDEKYSTPREMERHEILGYGKKEGLYEQVIETFKGFNVKIIKGPVPETLCDVDTDKVSYLSVDMNCVQPEIDALNFFWDKMVSGGIIVLDDYGFANASNDQKEAHDAFAKSKGVMVLTLPTCQGLIIKP